MPSFYPIILVIALAAIPARLLLTLHTRKPTRLPLPPGTLRLPLIGNLHQDLSLWPWRTYNQWSRTYGPVMYLRYGDDNIIMLSSHIAAKDLLDTCSAIYSSRPHSTMGSAVVSKGHRFLLMPYGLRYRMFQRIQGGVVGLRMAGQGVGLQDLASKQLGWHSSVFV